MHTARPETTVYRKRNPKDHCAYEESNLRDAKQNKAITFTYQSGTN
jgi:hypothetical protein